MNKANPFDLFSDEYEAWYDENNELFNQEVNTIKELHLPAHRRSIEIGGGTGRFAEKLGIRFLIDPALNAANKALKKNIAAIYGKGEQLPLKPGSIARFYFIFSLCFVEDPQKVLQQVLRINQSAEIVIMYIRLDSDLGRKYEEKKAGNKFYKNARFFTKKELNELLNNEGFIIRKTAGMMYDTAGSPGLIALFAKAGV